MFTRFARLFSSVVTLMVAICIVSARGRTQEIPLLSVCDLLKDLNAWSGKLIAIRGDYVFGTDWLTFDPEWLSVAQGNCPVVPETDGEKWVNNINLWVWSPPENLTDAEKTLADSQSVQAMREIASPIMAVYLGTGDVDENTNKLTATFVGTLRTKPLTKLTEQYGSGYGPHGFFPAEIVPIAARDIVVTITPSRTQGEPATLDTCGVLRDPRVYGGKTIAINGELVFTGGVLTLIDRKCPSVPNAETWSSSIDLKTVTSSLGAPDVQDTPSDPRSVRILVSLISGIQKAYYPQLPPFKITATFVGTLRAVESNGLSAPSAASGFGLNAESPAQLQYTAVRDLVITQINSPPPTSLPRVQ